MPLSSEGLKRVANYLSEWFAKVLGQERVQEWINATAAVRQNMCHDLHYYVHVRHLPSAHRLEQQNDLKPRTL